MVSSNRVLIRFTSGSYKPDVFAKKGFIAELSSSSSIVPSLLWTIYIYCRNTYSLLSNRLVFRKYSHRSMDFNWMRNILHCWSCHFFMVLVSLFRKIVFWIWKVKWIPAFRKGRLDQLRQRCCCCCSVCNWPGEYNSSVEEEHSDHLSSLHPQDVVRQTSTARMIPGGVYQRHHETIKPSDSEECDTKHWEQTKRLEKWHSTQHKNRSSSWAGI